MCSEGAARLAEALLSNSSLAALDLQDNAAGDAGAAGFAAALARNRALRHLNLSNNGVGPAGAAALAAPLAGSALQELNLAGNALGPAGARALAAALRENTSLLEVRAPLFLRLRACRATEPPLSRSGQPPSFPI